jgi:hypothetical protein
MRLRATIAALLVTGAASAVQAQAPALQAAAGVTLQSYTFSAPGDVGIDRVSLLTIPLAAQLRPIRQVELHVGAAWARGELTREGGAASTLSGITDTELRLTFATPRDRVRITAVALLPTGQTELTAEEMDVAGTIAADLLPFAIANWGTGGGIGMSAATALPLGAATTLGFAGGYVVARRYEPVSATRFAYRPGNQLHVRAALDHSIGTSAKAALQFTWQQYGTDEAAGSNLYQAGDRMQVVGSYAFAAGARASGIAFAGYLRRGQGRYTDVVRVTPVQDLVYGGLGMRLPAAGVVLTPLADVRVVGRADGRDQGYTLSVGTGAEVGLGGSLLLVPSVRGRFGNLNVVDGVESRFTGFEVGATIRTRGAR